MSNGNKGDGIVSDQAFDRERAIAKLQSISFYASLTALSSEGCIEAEVLTKDGADYSWLDEWYLYKLRGIQQQQWNLIRGKLKDKVLTLSDISGTDFERLYNLQNDPVIMTCSDFFASLNVFPESVPNQFYCLYGVFDYYDHPAFYLAEQDLCDDLANLFADDVKRWDEMSDDELEEWLSLYDPDEGIPYTEWDDED
jgi:hypothetical protein